MTIPSAIDDLYYPVTSFCGIPTAQNWTALFILSQLLSENRDILRVVELGTCNGGLSLFFGLIMAIRGGRVLTFDNHPQKPGTVILGLFDQLNVQFERRDVFDPATIVRTSEFIKEHRALVFCDDGMKKKEFPLYALIVKRGDLIMAHDWGTEFVETDLDREVLAFLEPYHQNEFDLFKTLVLSMRRIK